MNYFKNISRFQHTQIRYSILFVLLLIVVSLIYRYDEILFLPPQSVHLWRQCDCTSMALMYAEHGLNFFKPEMHNLHADGQTSGYAVGEFPIIYYFAAILYKLFGHHDFLLRGINLFIFFTGLFFLFKLIYLVSKDYFHAMLFPLLLFTSPLLVYYANNFLPEAPSLGLVLIGWYYFFKMRQQYQMRHLILFIFFFTLASLIKVSSGINLVLAFILWFLESTKILRLNGEKKIFRQAIPGSICFLASFTLIIAWYLFAINYNENHSSTYFRTGIMGFWQIPKEESLLATNMFLDNWKFFIFNDSVYIILGIVFLTLIFLTRNKFLNLINLLLLIGIAIFISLWYGLLFDHDYYFVPLLVIVAILFISFSEMGNKSFPKVFRHIIFKLFLSIILLINITYASSKVSARYSGFPTIQNKVELFDIENFLDSLRIEKDAKIICTPDSSPNQMLYLLNRQGWSDIYGMNTDSLSILQHIRHGAKYLFVHNNIPKDNYELNEFIDSFIGEKGLLQVYKLKSPEEFLIHENNSIPE